MRRATVLILTLGMAGATWLGSPAAADQPATVVASDTFVDRNPCTGRLDVITISFAGRVHDHGDRFVAHLTRSGATDSGYVLVHGVQHRQSNGRVETVTFTDRWRHPDGSRFVVQGLAVFDPTTFDARVDRFSMRCLGRPG